LDKEFFSLTLYGEIERMETEVEAKVQGLAGALQEEKESALMIL